jgi:hypothetical protein
MQLPDPYKRYSYYIILQLKSSRASKINSNSSKSHKISWNNISLLLLLDLRELQQRTIRGSQRRRELRHFRDR